MDLGTYLGVPIFHNHITKKSFHFLLDRIQSKLNGYDASLLSMAGRITLAKSVLLAIPGYFMRVVMILIGICEKIEAIVRQFVWGSSSTGRKMSLVKWEKCVQPKPQGGLGIRCLLPQNASFLMKLAFNFVSRKLSLWVKVLRSKYKITEVCPQVITRARCSFIWRSLSKI